MLQEGDAFRQLQLGGDPMLASGEGSIAMGVSSQATAEYSTAIGAGANATTLGSIGIGTSGAYVQ